MKTLAIVGKITNGVVKVVAATENRIAGYQRPLHEKEGSAASMTTNKKDIVFAYRYASEPQVKKVEVQPAKVEGTITSPFISMVNENHKRHMEKKKAEEKKALKKARRYALEQKILSILALEDEQ